ncbi:MAG: SIS domain-containing protein [Elusimicrobia bacterium]|nr:SIS domain-containing protein [Elusimicrobiota bacterium]
MSKRYFEKELIDAIESKKSLFSILPQISRAARLILKTIKSGKKVIVFGNGGSAADAQHFATELVCKFKKVRRPLKAITLTTNTSLLTATSNDFGFEKVFSRQVDAVGERGDVAVAISTSGNSQNVITAIKTARKKGIKVIGLLGFKGGKMKKFCDISIVVPLGNVARIQEAHEFILHSIASFLDDNI